MLEEKGGGDEAKVLAPLRSADVCREPSGNDLARPVNQPGRLRSVLNASFYFETGSLYIAQGTLELTL